MPRPFSGSCLFGYMVRPSLPVSRPRQKADDLWCNTAYRGGRAARRTMLRRRWLWVGLSHSGTRTYAVPAGRAGGGTSCRAETASYTIAGTRIETSGTSFVTIQQERNNTLKAKTQFALKTVTVQINEYEDNKEVIENLEKLIAEQKSWSESSWFG